MLNPRYFAPEPSWLKDQAIVDRTGQNPSFSVSLLCGFEVSWSLPGFCFSNMLNEGTHLLDFAENEGKWSQVWKMPHTGDVLGKC